MKKRINLTIDENFIMLLKKYPDINISQGVEELIKDLISKAEKFRERLIGQKHFNTCEKCKTTVGYKQMKYIWDVLDEKSGAYWCNDCWKGMENIWIGSDLEGYYRFQHKDLWRIVEKEVEHQFDCLLFRSPLGKDV